MKIGRPILLFFEIVIVWLVCIAALFTIKSLVSRELWWCGYPAIIFETGFHCALLLTFLLTGFLAAFMFREYYSSRNDAIFLGAGFGALIGVFFFFIVPLLPFYHILGCGDCSSYLSIQEINIASFLTLISKMGDFFVENYFGYLLIFLPIFIISGIAGALVYWNRFRKSVKSYAEPPNKKQPSEKKLIVLFLAGILISVIVPLCVAILVAVSGFAGVSYCDVWYPLSVNVSRVDDSTMNVSVSQDFSHHFWVRYIHGEPRHLEIFIDGTNYSNQSIIREHGLGDTITPPEGIINDYAEGSFATVSGPGIIRDNSKGRHVRIISHFDPAQPWTMADTYV